MSFQKAINRDLALGVQGDFASTNPYHSVLAGEGKLVAGTGGVKVGVFAWVDPVTGVVTNAQIPAGVIGFVRRENNASILSNQENSMTVLEGVGLTLYDGGDFWAFFAAGATVGQKVCASNTNGEVVASDTVAAGYTDTGFVVASNAPANSIAKITKF